jgi:type II secretory pathway pseudopilin PulG
MTTAMKTRDMSLVDPVRRGEPVRAPQGLDDGGFVMVALLVGIAVSAVWMAALLPSWAQQETREREAELIFRGEQYARAIYLYRQKNNQLPPPNIDTLVSQRYLRKKYLDPMTGKDFLAIGGAAPAAGRGGPGVGTPAAGPGPAGLTGVRSTSNETSIVLYRNQQTYSQFPFDWTAEAQRSGMGPAVAPGGRGREGPGTPGRGGNLERGGVLAPRRGGAGPGRGSPAAPGLGGRGPDAGPGRGAPGGPAAGRGR